jgi:hypothetical protein
MTWPQLIISALAMLSSAICGARFARTTRASTPRIVLALTIGATIATALAIAIAATLGTLP